MNGTRRTQPSGDLKEDIMVSASILFSFTTGLQNPSRVEFTDATHDVASSLMSHCLAGAVGNLARLLILFKFEAKDLTVASPQSRELTYAFPGTN